MHRTFANFRIGIFNAAELIAKKAHLAEDGFCFSVGQQPFVSCVFALIFLFGVLRLLGRALVLHRYLISSAGERYVISFRGTYDIIALGLT